jgi:hypothetical protein
MGHAAGVVEQLAEAYPVAVAQATGQPALQGVRQREAALRGQPQDDGGDQRLGHAAGPEAELRTHRLAGLPVGQAAGGPQAATLVPDPAGGAWRPGGHQPVQQLLQLAHVPLTVPWGTPSARQLSRTAVPEALTMSMLLPTVS